MLHAVLLLLLLSEVIASQSVIKTLPGLPVDLPFIFETGYIGVGKSEDVQLFYYFIESERNPEGDPLLLWLTGGPGCSGLSGLLYEFGPFTFNYANSSGHLPTLELNPYSWTKVANIIFLDQPAGTGFSYAKTSETYSVSDTLSAAQTYSFLRKWLMCHPMFLDNPLYIGGDSYTGIIVPIIVQEIYNGNENGNEPSMNIKGYLEGNPLTDKSGDNNSKVKFAHRMALISDELYESANSNCRGEYLDVDPNNAFCLADLQQVQECVEKIYNPQILEPWCGGLWSSRTSLLEWDPSPLEDNPIDLLSSQHPVSGSWCRNDNYLHSSIWANDRTVQNVLNVREGTKKEWPRCNRSMSYTDGAKRKASYTFDIQSSVDYHRNLTEKYCRVLIYSGDHDMVVPHLGTEEWIKSLNLRIESGWKPWFVEGQVAGYTVKYSHDGYELTYATVKGAGHTAPEYKPKQCLAMVSRWFASSPL